MPECHGVDGLDIEVTIDQHGRFAGVNHALGIDEGQGDAFDHLGVAKADGVDVGGQPFGGAAHIGMIVRDATDAGDANQGFEFFEEAVTIAGRILQGCLGHRSVLSPSSR